MLIAAHDPLQPQNNHHSVASLLEGNRISNGGGSLDEGRDGEWATRTLTHWRKQNNECCYFTSVFYESVKFLPIEMAICVASKLVTVKLCHSKFTNLKVGTNE
ncbi:hypothetical protein EVAR_91563_1 [Eumeta japonica]|uniref:Uncharacterized protein n=1 Tax=Eumeta variegata TaxID=151549 RepID=A0A4C1X8Z7_EUMVA|nr:hypothetical protein EVAR_91563_1 [Eumeta japonica]